MHEFNPFLEICNSILTRYTDKQQKTLVLYPESVVPIYLPQIKVNSLIQTITDTYKYSVLFFKTKNVMTIMNPVSNLIVGVNVSLHP